VTNFAWWAAQVPEGTFWCCICFETYPVDQASVDEDGQKWDVCVGCKRIEDAALAARAKEADGGR
jgi:hypothetical protein